MKSLSLTPKFLHSAQATKEIFAGNARFKLFLEAAHGSDKFTRLT
jgi:hypothetical protein